MLSEAIAQPRKFKRITNPLSNPEQDEDVIAGTDEGFGYEKQRQEDALGKKRGKNWLAVVLADGVGGDPDGDLAAQGTVEALENFDADIHDLRDFHSMAHEKLKSDPNDLAESGAAYLAAVIREDKREIELSPVGDAQLVVIGADGEVRHVTKLKRSNDDEEIITQWVDGAEEITPIDDPYTIELQPGDTIITYTDGVGNNFSPKEIALMTKGRSAEDAFKIMEVATRLKMTKGLPKNIAVTISGLPTNNAIATMERFAATEVHPKGKPDNRTLLIFKANQP